MKLQNLPLYQLKSLVTLFMSVDAVSLIFGMHGRKMTDVWFCGVLPGWGK